MHPRCSPRSDELVTAPCEKSFHAVSNSPMRYFLTRNEEAKKGAACQLVVKVPSVASHSATD